VQQVANDPTLGHRTYFEVHDFGRVQDVDNRRRKNTEHGVWSTVTLQAPDQLRQRMAFCLSEIFVVTDKDVSHLGGEGFLSYYDIFVRGAFGNYRDVLREVSYSPIMGQMLTFIRSSSFRFSNFFPDENYAREVMELFTVGLVMLHENGTAKLDAAGNPIETYDTSDVQTLARAWTGFDRRSGRGNIEEDQLRLSNEIDPMWVKPDWRDMFPKRDLYDGFIGDGFPLCADLPLRPFLRKGAKFHYLGLDSTPLLQLDPVRGIPVRMRLGSSSQLYDALCARATPSGNCTFPSTVTLPLNLLCDGLECGVDTVRVVEVGGTGVFYEFERPPCVELAFFAEGRTIFSRGGARSDIGDQPLCANPLTLAAGGACCTASDIANENPEPRA
jgi:hypothetical protein